MAGVHSHAYVPAISFYKGPVAMNGLYFFFPASPRWQASQTFAGVAGMSM